MARYIDLRCSIVSKTQVDSRSRTCRSADQFERHAAIAQIGGSKHRSLDQGTEDCRFCTEQNLVLCRTMTAPALDASTHARSTVTIINTR